MGYVVGASEAISEVPFHAKKDCTCVLDASIETVKALFGERADALYVETVHVIGAFYKERKQEARRH